MEHGGIFEGIGGFALAAQESGIQPTWSIEIDPWCCDKLHYRFSHQVFQNDINGFDLDKIRPVTHVSCGFPCQDISAAGNGLGINGAKSSVWRHVPRVLERVRPRFCLIENSPRLTRRGMEKVLFDLARIGYDAEWDCFSAAECGAYHFRKRLFILAYPKEQGRKVMLHRVHRSIRAEITGKQTRFVDSQSGVFERFSEEFGESPVFRMADGLPKKLDAEKRLGALGNSVFWRIPYHIFSETLK